MSRTTISLTEERKDDLEALKVADESYDVLLARLIAAYNKESVDDPLTESHIDDIAARVSRRTCDEVVDALSRR